MENFLQTQSNTSKIILFFGGTTSLTLNINQPSILPLHSYPYQYVEEQPPETYLLKHEIMTTPYEDNTDNQLVDMPIIRNIKAKFNKPVSLKFTYIEDNWG